MELEATVMWIIPRKFWDRTFGNFEVLSEDLALALSMAKKYVEKQIWKQGANLILLGPYGTGKTHLAAAITREAIVRHSTAVFITAPTIHQMNFNTVKDVDLLTIDDISSETNDKETLKKLFLTINYRYEAEKGIVITSNLSLERFKKIFGSRIFDRLYERSVFVVIKDTSSYRKRKREQYLDWLEEEKEGI